MVYTQTVAIVVYGYFLFGLIGHQYVGSAIDLYVPWLAILQFIFYVGWLNVARDLMHPFGEGRPYQIHMSTHVSTMECLTDDDDIELNCILDRHAAVAYSLATEVREESPDIIYDEKIRRDMGQKMSNSLTYSVAATRNVDHPPKMRAHITLEDENEQIQVQKTPQHNGNGGILAKLHLVKNYTPPNYF